MCQIDCDNIVVARRDVMPGSCAGKRRGKTKQNGDHLGTENMSIIVVKKGERERKREKKCSLFLNADVGS